MIQKIAIISNDNNIKTRECVQRLINELCERNIGIYLHRHSDNEQKPYDGRLIEGYFTDLSEINDMPDMIFSVGGDGTFLETASIVQDKGIPIAGINTGRMGFLANISNDDLGKSIDLIQDDQYETINRTLLEVTTPANLFGQKRNLALNEVTIQKNNLSMITIHVYVNDVFLNTYWADGIIIATATGSTAYNLSVGGPILYPDDESIVIVPISPHNLTVRPLVLSGHNELKLYCEGRVNEFLTTCDSQSKRLPIVQQLNIKTTDFKLKTIMLKDTNFFNTLRNRLMWGIDKRN